MDKVMRRGYLWKHLSDSSHVLSYFFFLPLLQSPAWDSRGCAGKQSWNLPFRNPFYSSPGAEPRSAWELAHFFQGCHICSELFFQLVSLPQIEPQRVLILEPINFRLKMQGTGWASTAGSNPCFIWRKDKQTEPKFTVLGVEVKEFSLDQDYLSDHNWNLVTVLYPH